jgi:hypothetical protein
MTIVGEHRRAFTVLGDNNCKLSKDLKSEFNLQYTKTSMRSEDYPRNFLLSFRFTF